MEGEGWRRVHRVVYDGSIRFGTVGKCGGSFACMDHGSEKMHVAPVTESIREGSALYMLPPPSVSLPLLSSRVMVCIPR